MSDGKIGVIESVSIALGGMIGGGIFAVLGVVAETSGTAAWVAFLAAGAIAAAAAYSFVKLNNLTEVGGGPVTCVYAFTESTTLGGIVSWTLLVGYVGTMAMYAFAFGGYFVELLPVQQAATVPLRPVVSVTAIGSFLGLNLLGARATGRAEDLLVAAKVGILLLFALGGLWFGFTHGRINSGLAHLSIGPLIAAAISFVAFEGWELLLFDQDQMDDPKETARQAIYLSIAGATTIYILVALVTTNLVSAQEIAAHPETALAIAAEPFLGQLGFTLIAVAALFSTGSAINATLFSSAEFATRLVSHDLLPDRFSAPRTESTHEKPLLVLGTLAALFSAVGSLQGITSFASLAFITVSGIISAIALTERHREEISAIVPTLGLAGTVVTFPVLLWHLYTTKFGVFVTVVGIALTVLAVELLYFERESITDGIHTLERVL
jgi:amino acid transporter